MLTKALRTRSGTLYTHVRAMCVLCCIGVGLEAAAVDAGAADTPPRAITDANQFWTLSPAERSQIHPLRLEGRVSYFDPAWKMLWIEHNNAGGVYVALGSNPPSMRDGQHVVIEGSIIPDKGLSSDLATVKVVQDYEPVIPLSSHGRINDMAALGGRIVAVDAFVDSQQYIDDDHVRLAMIVDDRPVIGWVKPASPDKVPNWAGKFIRSEGVYSARFDPTNTQTTIELWFGAQENIKVLGELETHAVFNLPRTPVNELHRLPPDTPVLVRGRADAHEASSYLVIRDDTGQVVVQSLQTQRIPYGTEVEAVGRVGFAGPKWVLRSALYRRAAHSTLAAREPNAPIDSADELRQLSLDEAAHGRPVNISGLVTWSLPTANFFFVQALSGGIRVRYDRTKMETPALGKYLGVEGTTYAGEFMPAVDVRNVRDLGSMSPPAPKAVTFEQAVTGREDGQWVEMRGFLQGVESVGELRLIKVTTPAGEFVGNLQSPVNIAANPGSLIRIQGVCEAKSDGTGRLATVMLRVPFLHSITIEEEAPADSYDLPERSIKALRQISGARDMTRVRVSGTVLHNIPGRTVYVEEGGVGLQLLTRQDGAVLPGEQIQAVGILGWEGARVVLRESVYRRHGASTVPSVVTIVDPSKPDPALDARLVRVRGLLIDTSRQREFTRLTLQSGTTLFEATLDRHNIPETSDPPVGALLELTGIYQLAFDDSRQTRGFSLQLRSPSDIVISQSPRLLTLQRAMLALAALGGCSLLGLAWITALRRRVRQQTGQIREQLERQARLEAEVQRAARLESLGLLAGGIAHDFNNLLTIIMGNLGLAMLDSDLSPTTARCLKEIGGGAVRAQSLTRQLLTFAKGGDPVRTVVEPAELVRGTADRALHGASVQCEYGVAPDLWCASADKDQLAQVVQNLVVNAVQAMPAGGALRIALRNETIVEGTRKSLPPGRYVRLTFTDSGEGIKPENLSKIFDPYFSTRKAGSGLGLATVYSIVKRHEGLIEVHSAIGVGSTFDVWIPASDQPAPDLTSSTASPLAPTATPGKIPRVLLMDDEQSIRHIGEIVLRRMGLEPVVVADGAAAVREFSLSQHTGRPFDLVILDLTIAGGMGGKETIGLLRKLDDRVPAIVSSGYSSDPVMANFAEFGFSAMVSKPYEIGQLAAVINRLLGRAQN